MNLSLRIVLRRSFCSKALEMVKVLNVAEKNDAAKSIAEVMSRGRYQRREGFSRFNKIYEYDYRLLNQNCAMVMTSVSGHLLGLEFVGQYRKWNSCSPVALFDVPVEKYCPENFQDIKRTLEREVRGSQFLVIWTDCDREGENIGFEIIQVCKAVKPNLQVYRAKFSEITPQAIERACRALIAPDKRTNDAVDVRMELDLRIGASFTRFQTKRLQKIFPGVLADQLISYGSCQFPTLGFVVERYKQVQAFIPEPFWKLKVVHKMEEGTVEFTWKRNRLFDYMACYVLYEHCIENPLAKVLDVKGRSKSKWRPAALDTVELEKSASRKLRISAKDTMKIAEKLYTQGFISYPRTETNQFPKELDLVTLCQAQAQDPNWGEFAQRVLETGPTPRNGNKTDNAHPPIHPTKYTNNLQGDEKKIYEFIVRHFLACCSQDAQGYETTVEISVADEMFSVQGLMITAKNYLEVYIYEKWNAKQVPVFTVGDEFEPSAIEMNSGETSPPSLLTEADLIALMDKHGIGTDATHAEHIETIKSRMYVGVRQDGRLVPGQLGMGLVEGYDAMGYEMSKPHLRAELEADLKKICEGTKQKQVVLEAQVKKYKEVFIEACRQAIKIDEALAQYLGEEAQAVPANEEGDNLTNMATPVLKCPLCGLDMLLKPKKDKGFYIGCMGFPDCRSAVWLPESVVEASVSDQTCQRCGPSTHKVNFKFKRGSVPPTVPLEYSGCIVCDSVLTEEVGIKVPRQQVAPSQRSQAPLADSGYGSNSSFNSTSSRSMSTQAGQRNITDMFSPNTMRVTSGSRNNNSQANRSTGSNSSSFNTSNSYDSSNISRNMNGFSNSGNSFSNAPAGRGSARQPLAVVTGNTRNSGNNFNQSGGGMTGNSRNFGSNLNQSGGSSRLPITGGGDADGENKIVCNCGNDALQLTVRKEGPNTGRQFYKCAGSSCSFFLWADEAGSENTGGSAYGNSTSHVMRKPICRVCDQGRFKPACAATEARNNSSSNMSNGYQSGYNRNTSGTGNRSWDQNSGADNSNSVQCGCGQPAKSLTVQKEGPNKGRQFYGCPAPRGQGCNFFQWADDDGGGGGGGGFSSGGPGQGGRGRGRGRGGSGVKRPASEGGGPAKKRKCGYCGDEGHNRRNCPHT